MQQLYVIKPVGKSGKKFKIDFYFTTQSARLVVELESKNTIAVTSDTDGYHWLGFWLSQSPNAVELLDANYEDRHKIINEKFAKFGMVYEEQDKELAYMQLSDDFNERHLEILAKIALPAFANRENFFDDFASIRGGNKNEQES
jgi:hypothetical protein